MEARQTCRAALTGPSPSRRRPHITGWLRLAFACGSVLLIGAATGCSGSSAPPGSGANSSAGGQPATSQSGAAPGWRAATHLDHSHGEDPTSVSCPSASFCMAVLGSGYAAKYDGTTWSQPIELPSAAGQPDSVSCPTVRFCMAVDAQDSSAFRFNGSTWSLAPRIDDHVPSTQRGMASVSCSSAELLCRRRQRLQRVHVQRDLVEPRLGNRSWQRTEHGVLSERQILCRRRLRPERSHIQRHLLESAVRDRPRQLPTGSVVRIGQLLRRH